MDTDFPEPKFFPADGSNAQPLVGSLQLAKPHLQPEPDAVGVFREAPPGEDSRGVPLQLTRAEMAVIAVALGHATPEQLSALLPRQGFDLEQLILAAIKTKLRFEKILAGGQDTRK